MRTRSGEASVTHPWWWNNQPKYVSSSKRPKNCKVMPSQWSCGSSAPAIRRTRPSLFFCLKTIVACKGAPCMPQLRWFTQGSPLMNFIHMLISLCSWSVPSLKFCPGSAPRYILPENKWYLKYFLVSNNSIIIVTIPKTSIIIITIQQSNKGALFNHWLNLQ